MINAVSMELSDACGNDPGFICEWIWDNTENEKLSEIVSWIIERPLKVVVILLVAMIVNRLLRRAIDRMVQRIISVREQEQTEAELESEKALSNVGERARRRLQRISEHGERSRQRALTLGAVLRGTSTTIVYLMGLMIALGEIGLDLGPLLAGAGIVGLAIGFGAQSLVADFIAGVFVIIEDHSHNGSKPKHLTIGRIGLYCFILMCALFFLMPLQIFLLIDLIFLYYLYQN